MQILTFSTRKCQNTDETEISQFYFNFNEIKILFNKLQASNNQTYFPQNTGGPRYSRTFYLQIRLFTFEK